MNSGHECAPARQAEGATITEDHLTPAEADDLTELLNDKVAEFMAHPYSDELREAIRKMRAVAELHTSTPSTAGPGER